MRIVFVALMIVLCSAVPVLADTITFSNQATFMGQLTGSYTLVNLDAAPLNSLGASYHVDDTNPAAAFSNLGIDFIGYNAEVRNGQHGQISTPNRDRLILNGTGLANGGEILINFLNPVNGIGAFSNLGDGGRIFAFTGLNGTGTSLGPANFGNGGFGGVVSDQLIQSAKLTCDFNQDHICGVYDLQFGTVAAAAVPEPAASTLLMIGSALLGVMRRSRSSK